MKVQCERCKLECECTFYGEPADVEEKKSQNGEWLCEPCILLRLAELATKISAFDENIDKAVKLMEDILDADDS